MDENLRLQNGLNLFCMVKPCGLCPKRRMLWSQLEALHDFQNMSSRYRKGRFLRNS